MLSDRDADAAIELSEYYFSSRKQSYHDNHVWYSVAHAKRAKNETDGSIAALEAAFVHEVSNPKQLTEASVELPFVIACLRREMNYPTARKALKFAEEVDLLLFPAQRFKWHVAQAFIADDEVQWETASDHASQAMEEFQKTSSDFRRHPKSGLVQEVEPRVLERLRRLGQS